MLDIGMQELIVIFAVALMVIGPKRLPELSRKLGRAVGHFKKALFDMKYELNKEIEVMEEEAGITSESDEPKWKQAAMEAIYGKNDPDSMTMNPPGQTDQSASTDQSDQTNASEQTDQQGPGYRGQPGHMGQPDYDEKPVQTPDGVNPYEREAQEAEAAQERPDQESPSADTSAKDANGGAQ